MDFELTVPIRREPQAVFDFLADVQRFAVSPGSPVVAMEKFPAGPTRVGTQWREVIRLGPLVRWTVRSTATAVQRGRLLGMTFSGPLVRGYLAYRIEPREDGSLVRQIEAVDVPRLLRPVVARTLEPRLRRRLEEIRDRLEADGAVPPA